MTNDENNLSPNDPLLTGLEKLAGALDRQTAPRLALRYDRPAHRAWTLWQKWTIPLATAALVAMATGVWMLHSEPAPQTPVAAGEPLTSAVDAGAVTGFDISLAGRVPGLSALTATASEASQDAPTQAQTTSTVPADEPNGGNETGESGFNFKIPTINLSFSERNET